MQAERLQTEYLVCPIGLGIRKPRFYWNCTGGTTQSAYQIVATCNDAVLWDSGKVISRRMTHIRYEGAPLQSRNRIFWAVKLWDENDVEGAPVQSWFELGLLEESDWHARWITGGYKPQKNKRYPVDYFRKVFRPSKAVREARFYITACGLYSAGLNGARVGDFCLAPGCTDYRHRLQYQAYDVTALLHSGANTLDIQLADGWYRGSIGCFGLTNVFGRQTKLLCQLEITYEDATQECICGDETFRWSNDGPLQFADLKDGEIYDAAKMPTYTGKASIISEKLTPTAADNAQPQEHESFAAKLMVTPSGQKVLDFGQNIAGFISFTVKGEKGQTIKLRCGEILDENGEFTQKNIQVKKPVKEFGKLTEMMLITGNEKRVRGEMQPTPKQEVTFFCSGGEDTYKMSFSVFGFRYALLETDVVFNPAQCRAIAVYSALEQTGVFECSNANVNRFLENTRWSMKGNYLDVPTDCPTRERLGWTGDAQVFFYTAAYLMEVAPFFRKWLRDIQDGQFKNGKSSAVVPYNGAAIMYDNTGASVGWADAVVLLPYRYWKCYGDVDILHEFYEMMRKYALFMIANTGHKNKKAAAANPYNQYTYEKGIHLGEWLEPEEFKDKVTAGKRPVLTEECTAYLHYTMAHMAEIARTLHKPEDEALFCEYANGAVKAYNHLFLQGGTMDTDRQAKLVRPLALGLLEGDTKQRVEQRLVQAVENRGYCIGTGFLSTPFVLPVLTQAGRADVAYKMLENEHAPSWLAEVKAGATTVWEDWEGTVSHNHYSPGAVCQWLFDTVAGIAVSGENYFAITPTPGGGLTFAKAEYQSLYGRVESRWERTKTGIRYEVKIPSNARAKITLPGGTQHTVGSGVFIYESVERSPNKIPSL